MPAATPHSVRLPPDLYETIKRLAHDDARSIGWMITKLLREAIAARTPAEPSLGQEAT